MFLRTQSRPQRLFHKAICKFAFLAARSHALSEVEHGIDGLGCVHQSLGKIAGIVPAAVQDDALVAVRALLVGVTNHVDARNLHPAALHTEG